MNELTRCTDQAERFGSLTAAQANEWRKLAAIDWLTLLSPLLTMAVNAAMSILANLVSKFIQIDKPTPPPTPNGGDMPTPK